MYNMHLQEHPFKADLTIFEIESSLSLREAYESTSPLLPIENTRIVVNDTFVTDYTLVPEDGDIVCIKLVPEGEEAATWTAIGGFALMVVGMAAMVIPGGQVAGAWMFGIGFACLPIAGVIARMGPPDGFGDQDAQSVRGGTGGTNQWGPIPVILGEHFIAPDFAAPDYTTIISNADKAAVADIYYVHQLYILGQSPLIVDKIAIGDTVAFVRKQDSYRVNLTKIGTTAAKIKISSSASNFKLFDIGARITLDGFTHLQNNGEYTVLTSTPTEISYRVSHEVRPESNRNIDVGYLTNTNTYKEINAEIVTNGDLSGTNYPWLVNEINVSLEARKDANNHPTVTTPSNVREVEVTISIPRGLYTVDDKGNKGTATATVGIYKKLITDEIWEHIGNMGFSEYKTPYNRDTRKTFDLGAKGQWMIQVRKHQEELQHDDGVNMIQFSSLICYKTDDEGHKLSPVSDLIKDDFTFLVLKIKATDQLNGTVSGLNCIIRQGNMVYDSTYLSPASIADSNVETMQHEKWFPGFSSNPASVFVSLFTNEITNRYPIGSASGWADAEKFPFDWETIGEWYTFCETEGHTCNGVVGSMSTIRTEIDKVCATGRAAFTIRDGLYTVIIDKPKTAVQLFSPRNTSDFSATRGYPEPFDGLRMKFTDKAIGYEATELIVAPPGSLRKKFDEMEVPYITDAANAQKLGEYYYKVKTLRQEVYTFSTDFEYLVCTAGDRVLFQHDVPLIGLASARIVNVIIGVGGITGLLLDEYVSLPVTSPASVYAVQVRHEVFNSATQQSEFQISEQHVVTSSSAEPTNIIDFLTPHANLNAFKAGELLAFGLRGMVTADLIITEISAGDNLTATITAVSYDEDVYIANTFPVWTPSVGHSGTSNRGVNIPSAESARLGSMQAAIASNKGNRIYNEVQPTPPYIEGDMWRRGISLYICTVKRRESETFNSSDWYMLTTELYQSISMESFGRANPEHRWLITPGGDRPLLLSESYIVESGTSSADNILLNDDQAWISATDTGKLLLPETVTANKFKFSYIQAKMGLTHEAYVSGRFGRNSWIGEAYTNLYSPSEQGVSTKDIVLSTGNYVLQCGEGTMTCKTSGGSLIGTAAKALPLIFSSAGGTYTFSTTNAKFILLTKTSFIPPYVDGTALANTYTYSVEAPRIEGKFFITNIPVQPAVIFEIYADTSNYLTLAITTSGLIITAVESTISSSEELTFMEMGINSLDTNDFTVSFSYRQNSNEVVAVVNNKYKSLSVMPFIDLTFDTVYVGKTHLDTNFLNNQVLTLTLP